MSAAITAKPISHDIIQKVKSTISQRLDAAGHKNEAIQLAQKMADLYFRNIPASDLSAKSIETLYGEVISLWSFAQDRPANAPIIRAFNPRFEEMGWSCDHTIIEIINDDMPFLVDSVTSALSRLDVKVHLIVHPVAGVKRQKNRKITDIIDVRNNKVDDKGIHLESMMHVEITQRTNEETLRRIEKALHKTLKKVRQTVNDWPAMIEEGKRLINLMDKTCPTVPDEDRAEAQALMKWLQQDHFTFLGFRSYIFHTDAKKPGLEITNGLGILADPNEIIFDELRHLDTMPRDVRAFVERPTMLMISKSSTKSCVHRPVHMDVIGFKRIDENGQVVGLDLFCGLFTAEVYTNLASSIPVLKGKIQRLMQQAGFRAEGHNGKKLLNILENLPRDELFQMSDEQLLETSLGVLQLQERQKTSLFVRKDEFERYVSCLAYLPRDRFDTKLRQTIIRILEETYNGTVSAYYSQLDDSSLARLHVMVKTTPGNCPNVPKEDVQAVLAEAARSWEDRLETALVSQFGEEEGARLFEIYGNGIPISYREHFPAAAAVADIKRIEETITQGDMGMNLYRPVEAPNNEVRFKLYHRGSSIPLTDVLPMLENMGFRVLGEVPYQWETSANEHIWIQDFVMETSNKKDVDVSDLRQTFQDAFSRIWHKEAADDGFNRLVVGAGLQWREVVILRAYSRYLRQIGFLLSQETVENALLTHASLTRKLVELFHILHKPGKYENARAAKAASEPLIKAVTIALENVSNPDEDRILRRYLNLIQCTLRTNYYQPAADGHHKDYISFKFNSKHITEMPKPRPWVEIFVYSTRVEGVHLRGGKVARGGLRWSDRREDFRTEILGLVKAQMVKNAVIVPVGSKGGFVVKNPPTDGGREAFMEEGITCYKTFIRGLLDITDNLDGERVVPPCDVVRHDDDDPYLVVAADKGTATFSDIANGIAEEYGFWLGDAFASGGSYGYDHKAMGITARGAWEAVKRHFREIGKDIQTEPFTCIGVGDMSGDVFGNGMLLSRQTRLLAAFNHMHIFIDPNPTDTEATWQERKRLFETPRTTWKDYNPKLISKGGGVLDRAAKRVTLTAEMQALTGLSGSATPNEVINALLKADVELMWFGGIGTYIKAKAESHDDAGDRANDGIRVNADELKCRVIGEGANLGVTQRGRIEAAFKGVRLNTDSIDNSAGVDCSDHEVNIKILLNQAVREGDLTTKQRNVLLEEMTDEVGKLVLRNNYNQTLAISLVYAKGASVLDHQDRLMRELEKRGRLDRAIEFLPTDDVLAERYTANMGMTRPEIAILLPYSKNWLFDQILASDLPDEAFLEADLVRYFPKPIQERFPDRIRQHPLRREIIATHTANSIINRVGGSFVTQIREKTGMPEADIARAYIITRDAFGLRKIWREIEALDAKVDADVQSQMLNQCNQLVDRSTIWILRHAPAPLDMTQVMKDLKPGVEELKECVECFLPEASKNIVDTRAQGFMDQGVPEDLAHKVSALVVLASANDIVTLATLHKKAVQTVAQLYFAIGNRFGLGWLRTVAEHMPEGNHWQKLATAAVLEELYSLQRDLTESVLHMDVDHEQIERAVDAWVSENFLNVERADSLLNELKGTESPDLSMLVVASRQLRAMSKR
jgi:glutamate dehydrogenase